MASNDAIFTSKYHTKKINPWPNLLASHVVNYSQLTTCEGETESLILKNTQILVDVWQNSNTISSDIMSDHKYSSCDNSICTWFYAISSDINLCFVYAAGATVEL